MKTRDIIKRAIGVFWYIDDECEYPMIDAETPADNYPENRHFMAVFDPTHVALMEAVVETARSWAGETNGYKSVQYAKETHVYAALNALAKYRHEKGLE